MAVALAQINAASPHPDVAVPFDYKALLEELEHERREKLYWQEVAEQAKHLADDLEAKLTAMCQREERHLTLIEELDTTAQRRKNLERVSSSVLSAGQKDTVSILYDYFTSNNAGEPNADGFYPIESKKLALRGGMASGTMNHHINYMATVYEDDKLPIPAKLPLFEKRLVHIHRTKKVGDFYEETWLKPTSLFWDNPLSWQNAVVAPRQQGGADRGQGRRKKCACGGDIVEKHITISMQKIETCLRCKTETAYEVQTVGIAYPVGKPENDSADSNQLDKDQNDDASSDSNQLEAVRLQESLQQVDLNVPLDVDTLFLDCNVLAELKALPVWCCHRQKVPYNAKPARSPQKAEADNSSTWTTYEQAQATYQESQNWKYPYDGIGFMNNNNGDYVFVDIDHCRDKDTGALTEEAQTLIERLPSYTEASYSETGVHIIVRGSIPKGRKHNGIEMYPCKRFFTFTGKHLAGTPTTIEPGQAALDALYQELFPAEPAPLVEFSRRRENLSSSHSDDEILRKARTDAKFCKLWSGDASDYRKKNGLPDDSRADIALCEKLSYWGAEDDVSTIDRLFQQSGLYREKWERADYREMTIKKAIEFAMRRKVQAVA